MRTKFWVKKNWGASISHQYQGFDSYPCMMCHGQNMVYGLLASNHETGNPHIGHCDLGFHGSWCVTLIQFISNYVFMNTVCHEIHIFDSNKNKSTQCLMLVHHGTAERPGSAWNEACFSSCGFLPPVFRPPLEVPWDTGDESLKGGVAWCGYGSKFGWPKQLAILGWKHDQTIIIT